MNCENIFCIYQFEGKCKLKKIEIDICGMCASCIYVEIEEEILLKAKLKVLNRI